MKQTWIYHFDDNIQYYHQQNIWQRVKNLFWQERVIVEQKPEAEKERRRRKEGDDKIQEKE